MPVTQGTYAQVETDVFQYLTQTLGFNIAVACGILANIENESGFYPMARNPSSGAYGLFQWSDIRRSTLMKIPNYYTSRTQMNYLKFELNGSEKNTLNALNKIVSDTANSAYTAGVTFSKLFERHGNESEDNRRGVLARDKYYPYYSKSENLPGGYNKKSIGQTIVETARLQVGKPYESGKLGPNSYDDAGLVYYSYRNAGVSFSILSSSKIYEKYRTEGRIVSTTSVAAGDLLFYKKPQSSAIDYVAIANGSGGRIYVHSSTGEVIEDTNSIGSPSYIIRILADSDTILSIGITPSGGLSSVTNYQAIVSNDPYEQTVMQNLSRVKAEGYDYGYLIDMTNTKEYFKFYVPEFSESAGANWTPIDIIGRSVSIQAYNSTSSRKITVNLDLYAGVGVYEGVTDDPVGRLHSDANFIKSLEYPDYTNPITRPPATVHLILGSAVNMIGVVSGVNIEHMKPVDSENRAMYLKVSFTVTQTAENPPDYTDIRANRYAIAGTDNRESIEPASEITNAPKYSQGGR